MFVSVFRASSVFAKQKQVATQAMGGGSWARGGGCVLEVEEER